MTSTVRDVALGLGLLAGLSAATAQASVMLTEGLSLTASWPEVGDVVTRPGANSVGSGGSSTSGGSLSETFTAPKSGFLQTVYLVYTGGAGTYKVSLYSVDAVNNQTYTPTSVDYFNPDNSAALTFTGTTNVPAAGAILKLAFTEDDEVALTSGGLYALEVAKVSGGDIALCRTGSSTYAGGSAYINRSAVNWPGVRDWAMSAVIATSVPEPSTLALLSGGLLLAARRRRA